MNKKNISYKTNKKNEECKSMNKLDSKVKNQYE